jgi:hypothetical protein
MITFLGVLTCGVLGWIGGWFAARVLERRAEVEDSAQTYQDERERGWPL